MLKLDQLDFHGLISVFARLPVSQKDHLWSIILFKPMYSLRQLESYSFLLKVILTGSDYQEFQEFSSSIWGRKTLPVNTEMSNTVITSDTIYYLTYRVITTQSLVSCIIHQISHIPEVTNNPVVTDTLNTRCVACSASAYFFEYCGPEDIFLR